MSERRVLHSDKFPSLLREINDPPKKLYLEGTLPDEAEYTYLAVIGSRKFSSYGKEACEKLLAGLAGHPIAIVSGLALGMDAIAHKAALKAGLPTIAVPGSGLDRSVLYPSSNRRLAEEIVDAGGALLSEFEPTFRATLYSFPQRNRIVAGMSKATLVVEAAEKSGALITARLALDYNRDVLVVPGSIFSPTAKGTNKLIRNGAMPVTSSDDILQQLGMAGEKTVTQATLDLTESEEKVLSLLIEPLPRDELFSQAELAPGEGQALLMTMELKGLIQEVGGEIHSLTS